MGLDSADANVSKFSAEMEDLIPKLMTQTGNNEL